MNTDQHGWVDRVEVAPQGSRWIARTLGGNDPSVEAGVAGESPCQIVGRPRGAVELDEAVEEAGPVLLLELVDE